MTISEALTGVFTDDPINWIKWIIVFAVLIGSYFIAIPLYGRVSYALSLEKKRDIARDKGHIHEAVLVKKWPEGDVANYNWHATYRYSFQGREYKHNAFFKHPMTPPFRLHLYYIDDPLKTFSYEEYHYENHKAVILFPLMVLPWILAVAAMFILDIPRPVM